MKIGYSKTFPVIGKDQWEKNWLEDEVNLNLDYFNLSDSDIEKAMLNVKKVQYALKRQVESFFYESKAVSEKQLTEQKEEPKTQEQKIISDISTVKDLKVLESYRLIAKKYPGIQTALDQKFLELSK